MWPSFVVSHSSGPPPGPKPGCLATFGLVGTSLIVSLTGWLALWIGLGTTVPDTLQLTMLVATFELLASVVFSWWWFAARRRRPSVRLVLGTLTIVSAVLGVVTGLVAWQMAPGAAG